MSSRRFFALLCFASLLFVSAFGGMGCGGGGGGGGSSSDGQASTFQVTFNSNGGSSVASQTVKAGETAEKPDNPTKSGSAFAGWYRDNSTFNSQFLFGDDGDAVESDITLYANWLGAPTMDEQKYAAAAASLVIGYRLGDNAGHVTGDLSLPTSLEGESGLTVSWASSNSSVVASDGAVTRPASDTDVTLTATLSDGTVSENYDFPLTVIHDTSSTSERGVARQSIHNNAYDEIVAMNTGGNEVYFTYDSSNGARRMTSIEGIYSTSSVSDVDDALDAIQGVHGLLGISTPSDELASLASTSDSYGSQYRFSQVYKGMTVFGRGVTVSTNADGQTNYLASNLFPTASLSGLADAASGTSLAAATKEQAEETALSYHSGGSFELGPTPTEAMVYTLVEYQEGGTSMDYGAAPVIAYAVNVCGTDGDGNYLDETIFVNADTGAVICAISNVHDAERVSARGNTETGVAVSFDVTYRDDGKFFMSDNIPPRLRMSEVLSARSDRLLLNDENEWDDGQAVSAYTNMTEVLKWWSGTFGRNSLNGSGMDVNLVVHDRKYTDNAYWSPGRERIYICEPGRLFDYSCAAARDALVHESAHAVIQYSVGMGFAGYYRNAPGAINEGYADIFACLNDRNWTIGEELFDSGSRYTSLRNVAVPDDSSSYTQGPSELGGAHYIDYTRATQDNGGVHYNSLLVSHAAYLMYEGGLTWDELGELWYKSMTVGLYDTSADFQTVRRAVLEAARQMGWSDEKKDIIAAAFEQEKIYDLKGTLSGVATDVDDAPIAGATVVASRSGVEFGRTTTAANGSYSLELSRNTYAITITASGYAEFTATQVIDAGEPSSLNLVMAAVGTGTLNGKVQDAANTGIEGATLTLRAGRRNDGRNYVPGPAVATATSAADGTYSFGEDIPLTNGGYNLEISKSGYATVTRNVVVVGETSQNITLSSGSSGTAGSGQWHLYLIWGDDVENKDEPYDLDAHVVLWREDGASVETYYASKVHYVDGDVISLDRDVIRNRSNGEDRTGKEEMVFTPHANGTVDYFIHWYNGSGSWASSKATVEIKRPDGEIITKVVPTDDSIANNTTGQTGTCWHVLRIQNGHTERDDLYIVDKILSTRRPQNPYSTSSSGVNTADLGSDQYPPK